MVGYPTLGALAAVIHGWFFLPPVSMNMGFLGKNSVTFYQGLKLLTPTVSRASQPSVVAAAREFMHCCVSLPSAEMHKATSIDFGAYLSLSRSA